MIFRDAELISVFREELNHIERHWSKTVICLNVFLCGLLIKMGEMWVYALPTKIPTNTE